MRSAQTRRATGLTLLELLVVTAIIAVLIGLLLPAVQKVRAASARTYCTNNLRQLGLALHNYHNAHGGFPPAAMALNDDETSSISWVPYLFPYIEQGNLPYDLTQGCMSDANHSRVGPNGKTNNQNVIKLLLCPSAPPASQRLGDNDSAPSDYQPIIWQLVGPNRYLTGDPASPYYPSNLPAPDPTYQGVMAKSRGRRLAEVTDGTANTLLLVECAGRSQVYLKGGILSTALPRPLTGWASTRGPVTGIAGTDPSTVTPLGTYPTPGLCAINCTNFQDVYAFHSGGSNMVFADGSVHFIADNMPLYVLASLFTRATGEVIPWGYW